MRLHIRSFHWRWWQWALLTQLFRSIFFSRTSTHINWKAAAKCLWVFCMILHEETYSKCETKNCSVSERIAYISKSKNTQSSWNILQYIEYNLPLLTAWRVKTRVSVCVCVLYMEDNTWVMKVNFRWSIFSHWTRKKVRCAARVVATLYWYVSKMNAWVACVVCIGS